MKLARLSHYEKFSQPMNFIEKILDVSILRSSGTMKTHHLDTEKLNKKKTKLNEGISIPLIFSLAETNQLD